ncbi:MAG: type II toxin-antitoxin system VapC family toxin [Candidatus Freyarchaeota archaeon]
MNYILDTNIIIALMKNIVKIKRKVQEAIFYGKEVSFNGISYYEIKRGLLAANATKQLGIFDELCKTFNVSLLDSQIIFDKASEIYADLKGRGELISDADILIGAIAITQNYILVTDDTDFQRIKGIVLENWLR